MEQLTIYELEIVIPKIKIIYMSNNAQEHINQLTNKAKIRYLDISIAFFKINVSIKLLFYSDVNSHNQNNF